MSLGRVTYHVQADSFKSACGRRIGTPGGKIYPGVHVNPRDWFRGHSYPDSIKPVICATCAKLHGGVDALLAAAVV